MPKNTKQADTSASVAASGFPLPDLITMLEAGVHFGHERSKRNPKMEPYIYALRNRIAILDLEKTQEKLKEAVDFLQHIAKNTNKEILFVGTKRQAREVVRRHAESIGMPYITQRWLGGTLTNFRTILKSVEKLDELKSLAESPSAQKMTKKERSVMRKEIERLETVLEGIMNIRALPAVIVIAGIQDEKLALREAARVGIPVVGIADTNANPAAVKYPVPGNDDAVRSLDLLVGTFARAIAAARGITVKTPATPVPAADKV